MARAAADLLSAEAGSRLQHLGEVLRQSANDLLDLVPPVVPGGQPDFVGNLLLTLLIAAVVGGALSIPLRMSWPRLALWLSAVLLPLAYTWTASASRGTPGCTVGDFAWELLGHPHSYEVLYNIELLIPAGAAAFLWPNGPRRGAALVTALAVPPLIEFGQYLFPQLNRACQFGDVFNNELGVIIGWCLAAGAVSVWRLFIPLQSPAHASGGRGSGVRVSGASTPSLPHPIPNLRVPTSDARAKGRRAAAPSQERNPFRP